MGLFSDLYPIWVERPPRRGPAFARTIDFDLDDVAIIIQTCPHELSDETIATVWFAGQYHHLVSAGDCLTFPCDRFAVMHVLNRVAGGRFVTALLRVLRVSTINDGEMSPWRRPRMAGDHLRPHTLPVVPVLLGAGRIVDHEPDRHHARGHIPVAPHQERGPEASGGFGGLVTQGVVGLPRHSGTRMAHRGQRPGP